MSLKVILAAGSSGGHIYPALCLFESLRKIKAETLLVIPKGSSVNLSAVDAAEVVYFPRISLKRGIFLKNFIALFNSLKSFLRSFLLLAKVKPDLCVGFGAAETVPVILCAWFFRIPTMIHEQNVVPGAANRLLAKFADKTAISFEDSRCYWKDARKAALTGYPVRSSLSRINRREAAAYFGLNPDKFTLLIFGGSLGARRINEFILAALKEPELKNSPQVIHICGKADREGISKFYSENNIPAKVIDFLEQMQYAYSASDLAVCRAGAGTVAELTFYNLPAILIPYPFAAYHQEKNALVLGKNGCALVFRETDLTSLSLAKELSGIMHNPDKLKNMRLNFNNFSGKTQSEALLNEALSLAHA